ncbi:MAG: tyrosine-type recombinase/integrase [Planctomycetota bacterium]|nr:tyrosine-type recombinase/integrase [Planctomycetota bacterium]
MASIYRPNKNCDVWWLKHYLGEKKYYRTSLQTTDKTRAELLRAQVEIAFSENKSIEEIEYLINGEKHPSEENKYEPDNNLNIPKNTSIEQELKSYFEMCRTYKAPRTVVNEKQRLRDFFDWMQVMNLRDISERHILNYITYKSKSLSPVSVNRYIDNIKTFWKYVSDFDGKYLKTNPAEKIKKIKLAKHIPRYLSLEEIETIRKSCSEKFRPIFETFLHTGMRKSELIYLEWQDVDLEKKEIIIRPKKDFTPKDKEPRIIPIDDSLYKILKDLKGDKKSGYVFCNSQGEGPYKYNLNRTLSATVTKAGIKDRVNFNILRHTYASYITMEGGIATAASLLGHSNIRLTRDFYSTLSPEFKSKIANKLPY